MRTSGFLNFLSDTLKATPRYCRRRAPCEMTTTDLKIERVIGLTALHNAAIAVNPVSNVIAYPAGSVVVVYNIKSNKQVHFFTASAKVASVAFSRDGKYLAIGELAEPGQGDAAVSIWRWEKDSLLRTLRGHSVGAACVAFSRDGAHLVTVGFKPPHAAEALLIMWAWKVEEAKVACARLRKRVHALAFSADGGYFVTAGERHVEYWYLDASGAPVESARPRIDGIAVMEPVAGNLAERNSDTFVDVACGLGDHAVNVYATTTQGALCCFGAKRTLLRWVGLRGPGFGIAVTPTVVMAACEGSMIHSFAASSFKYIATLPCPPALEQLHLSPAVAAAAGSSSSTPARPKPATLCIRAKGDHAFAVYGDRSLFVWDVSDPKRFGMYRSVLQHCGCVWDLQVPAASATPGVAAPDAAPALPPHSFATAAADGTVRLWTLDRSKKAAQARHPDLRTVYSRDMLRALPVVGGGALGVVVAPFDRLLPPKPAKGEGLRSLAISRDGGLLATGDKAGNLHLLSLRAFAQVDEIMAHDDEIIRVAFSASAAADAESVPLLASASLDNLVHVFAAPPGAVVGAGSYTLACTLDSHDAPITGMRFAAGGEQLLTCAAVGSDGKDASALVGATSVAVVRLDRSTEGQVGAGAVVPTQVCTVAYDSTAGTVLDVDVDPTSRFVVTASQGKHINIWRMESGRSVRAYSPESECYKVELDPSGSYTAACCLDKRIRIFDFYTGKCVVDVGGHSGIVTCARFTSDCKRLLTASSDGCVFVWKFHATLTKAMRQRMKEVRAAPAAIPSTAPAESRSVAAAEAAAAPRAEPTGLLGMMLTEAHTEASTDVHTVTAGKGPAPKVPAGAAAAAAAAVATAAAASASSCGSAGGSASGSAAAAPVVAAAAAEDAAELKPKLNDSQLQDWARTQRSAEVASASGDGTAAAALAAPVSGSEPPITVVDLGPDATTPVKPPTPAGRWTQSVDDGAKLLGKFPMRPTPVRGGGEEVSTLASRSTAGGSSSTSSESPSHQADATLPDDITVEEIMRELDGDSTDSDSPRRGGTTPLAELPVEGEGGGEEEEEEQEVHYAPASPAKDERGSDFEVTLKGEADANTTSAAPASLTAPASAEAEADAKTEEVDAAAAITLAEAADRLDAESAFDAKRVDEPQRDIERLMSPAPGKMGAAVEEQSAAQSDPLRRSLTSKFLKQHIAEHAQHLMEPCVLLCFAVHVPLACHLAHSPLTSPSLKHPFLFVAATERRQADRACLHHPPPCAAAALRCRRINRPMRSRASASDHSRSSALRSTTRCASLVKCATCANRWAFRRWVRCSPRTRAVVLQARQSSATLTSSR